MPKRSRASSRRRRRASQRAKPNMPRRGEAVRAVLLVEVDDDLDVGAGAEAVAAGGELFAQLLEVVDLAVADDGDCAVLVRDRLITGLEIDDAEAPEAQTDAGREVEALAVGAAMAQTVGHPLEHVAVDRPHRVRVDDTADPAHGSAPRFSPRLPDRGFALACPAGPTRDSPPRRKPRRSWRASPLRRASARSLRPADPPPAVRRRRERGGSHPFETPGGPSARRGGHRRRSASARAPSGSEGRGRRGRERDRRAEPQTLADRPQSAVPSHSSAPTASSRTTVRPPSLRPRHHPRPSPGASLRRGRLRGDRERDARHCAGCRGTSRSGLPRPTTTWNRPPDSTARGRRRLDSPRDDIQTIDAGPLEQHEVARLQAAMEMLGRGLDGIEGLERLVVRMTPGLQALGRGVSHEDHPVGDVESLSCQGDVGATRRAGIVGDGSEHDDLSLRPGLLHELQCGGNRPEWRLEVVAHDREAVRMGERTQAHGRAGEPSRRPARPPRAVCPSRVPRRARRGRRRRDGRRRAASGPRVSGARGGA